MKKRIFSLILACAMLLTAVPMLFVVGGAEDEIAFTSSFWEEAQAGKIVVDTENATVDYTGAWQASFIQQDAQGVRSIIPLSHVNPSKALGNYALTESSYNSMVEHPEWDIWYWGSLLGTGMMDLNNYTLNFGNENGIPLYLYNITQEGEFSISAEIENFVAPGEGQSYYFSVMVNEKLVWPIYGATWSYGAARDIFIDEEGAWFHVTQETTAEELNAALETLNVNVKTGDRLEFCYRYGDEKANYREITRRGGVASAMPKITARSASDA